MPPKNKQTQSEDDSEVSSVEVAFVLNDPSSDDNNYHACKVQLSRALQGNKSLADFLPEMTQEICEQCEVGSFLCVEGEEEWGCHGFISALSFNSYKQTPWIKAIVPMLSTAVSDKTKLLGLFKNHHVALLLQNRFINIPAFMVPPIYSNLLEDINWTQSSKEVSNPEAFSFDAFVILATLFDRGDEGDELDEDGAPIVKKNLKEDNSPIYLFPEYYIFEENAELVIDLPFSADNSGVVGRQARGFKAICLTKSQLEKSVKEIEKEITE